MYIQWRGYLPSANETNDFKEYAYARVATLKYPPELAEKGLQRWTRVTEQAQNENDTYFYSCNQDSLNKNLVHMLEIYKDKAQFEFHSSTELVRAEMAADAQERNGVELAMVKVASGFLGRQY